jgi:hypothetical protein
MSDLFTDADVLSTYSRAQALADGVLRDAGALAREAGIKWPVALTAALWAEAVAVNKREKSWGQSEEGRLWDVLWMLSLAIRAAKGDGQELFYRVLVRKGRRGMRPVLIKAVAGPGDDQEPVLTLMLPNED